MGAAVEMERRVGKPFFLMRRRDWLLCGALLLVAAGLFLCIRLTPKGGMVVVTCDGEVLQRVPLESQQSFTITTPYGENTFTISAGTVRVTGTDCPNGDCTRMSVTRTGGVIACLPHHLLVRLDSSGADSVHGMLG